MDDLQSNYRRDHATNHAPAIKRLHRIVVLTAIANLIFIGCAPVTSLLDFVFNEHKWSELLPMIRGPLFIVLGVLATWWCVVAYNLTTKLRKLQADYSSFYIALACFLSPGLFFLPMISVLDYVLQHSTNENAKPLRWYYPVSNSMLVNGFTVFEIVSIIFGINAQYHRSELFLGYRYDRLSGILNMVAMVIGLLIFRQVTLNLAKLAEAE